MRALIIALAIAGAACAASAQDNGAPNGMIRIEKPPPPAPGGVRNQAESAIKHGLGDVDGARFRDERVIEAESVKHGVFGPRIAGPVSVVCGQYSKPDRAGGYGGYAWFFVAIKRGQVLWADVDADADSPSVAYYDCKGAGLAS
jgi:hypothetical protein